MICQLGTPPTLTLPTSEELNGESVKHSQNLAMSLLILNSSHIFPFPSRLAWEYVKLCKYPHIGQFDMNFDMYDEWCTGRLLHSLGVLWYSNILLSACFFSSGVLSPSPRDPLPSSVQKESPSFLISVAALFFFKLKLPSYPSRDHYVLHKRVQQQHSFSVLKLLCFHYRRIGIQTIFPTSPGAVTTKDSENKSNPLGEHKAHLRFNRSKF